MAKDKKQMGRSARRKGSVVENLFVKNHQALGVECKRVPLSGAARGYKGDLEISALGSLRAEVKSRKGGGGFTTIENWLGGDDLLFLKRDRQDPLVVLPWSTYSMMMQVIVGAEAENCTAEMVGCPPVIDPVPIPWCADFSKGADQ